MTWLIQNTNLRWTGFCLTPAPSQQYAGWMGKREFLEGLGWGFAPVYVGQQTVQNSPDSSHELTAEQGRIDAQEAATLAKKAGFPDGTNIFLDIEQGPESADQPVGPEMMAYSLAWVDEMSINTSYHPRRILFIFGGRRRVPERRRPSGVLGFSCDV
jgi:hypothetical protein